jgi:hypothetical protein
MTGTPTLEHMYEDDFYISRLTGFRNEVPLVLVPSLVW